LDHDQPQRPCTSPRSMPRLMSAPPFWKPVTTLIGAWKMFFNTVGKISLSAPAPDAPMVVGLVMTSCQDLMPVVFQKAQIETSFETLPIQLYFAASNCVPWAWPNSGSTTRPRAKVPITVPFFGATL